MKRIAIIGSGDLGQQIAYHAIVDKQFVVAGFFDDFKNTGDEVDHIPVLGKIEDIFSCFENNLFDELLIGIGYKHMTFRNKLFTEFQSKIPFATLIHSSCFVDHSSVIEAGAVIFPGCLIDQHVKIKANALLNVGCCVSHHSEIGSHSFLSPRVAVAGFVKIGDNCILGINSTIIDNITIVAQTQIGGGGVVISNLETSGLYVGNPVRFIR